MEKINILDNLDVKNIRNMLDVENKIYNNIIIKSDNNNNNLLYINNILSEIFNCNLEDFTRLKLDKSFDINYNEKNSAYDIMIYEYNNIYFLDFNKVKYLDYPNLIKILDYLIMNNSLFTDQKNIFVFNNIDSIISGYISNINNYIENYNTINSFIILSENINNVIFNKTRSLCFKYILHKFPKYEFNNTIKVIKDNKNNKTNKIKKIIKYKNYNHILFEKIIDNIVLKFDSCLEEQIQNFINLDLKTKKFENQPNKKYFISQIKNNFTELDITNIKIILKLLKNNKIYLYLYKILDVLYNFLDLDIIKLYLITEKFLILDIIIKCKIYKCKQSNIEKYFFTYYSLTYNNGKVSIDNENIFYNFILDKLIKNIPFFKICYNDLVNIVKPDLINNKLINNNINIFVNNILSFNFNLKFIIKNILKLIKYININKLNVSKLYLDINKINLLIKNIAELDKLIINTQKENVILQQFILDLIEIHYIK